jgi:hypothetical protein
MSTIAREMMVTWKLLYRDMVGSSVPDEDRKSL